MPRYFSLVKYWETFPPQHVLLAAYVGYKPPAKEKATAAKFFDDFQAGEI